MKKFGYLAASSLIISAAMPALAQGSSHTVMQDGAISAVQITQGGDTKTAALSQNGSAHFSSISQTCSDAAAAVI